MTLVLKDIYKAYAKECKQAKKTPMPKKDFERCAEFANMELVNSIVFEAKEVALAGDMGSMAVVRYARKFEKPRVNFGETARLRKETDFTGVVYHTDDNWFMFKWIRKKCHVTYKTLWLFKPTHGNKNSVGGVKFILSQTLHTRPDLKARYLDLSKK